MSTSSESINPSSLKKGILVNLLNPNPYIFWITIGAPVIYKAYQQSLVLAVIALIVFYICLIGAKVLLAIIAGKYRYALTSKTYLIIVRVLGLVLWTFAGIMLWDGITLIRLH
jgi:threonine/homoserine/homoserine lactone efflux protein